MKKIVIAILLGLLAMALLACDEDNREPYITLLQTSDDCGVVPLQVEFYATASGGDPLDNPTGANLPLDIRWDFGDQNGAAGSALVFHTYRQPGEYLARVTVEDADGDQATATRLIRVLADTMRVWAESVPAAGPIATGVPVQLNVFAETCEFDPYESNYGSLLFRWRIDTTPATLYTGRAPLHTFSAGQVGTRTVTVSVENYTRSVVRRDTLTFEVQAP